MRQLRHRLLYDIGVERFGLNIRSNETFWEYFSRMYKEMEFFKTKDFSIVEFIPKYMKNINAHLKTLDNTYYFSISGSFSSKHYVNRKEMVKEGE